MGFEFAYLMSEMEAATSTGDDSGGARRCDLCFTTTYGVSSVDKVNFGHE